MSLPAEVGLKGRIEVVEEAYEFMLAYAAQGVTGEEEGGSGQEIRSQLKRADEALEGLAALATELVAVRRVEPEQSYRSFIEVLDQDARYAKAAIQLVLAQPVISSQLIDNLNALIHLRSLITDLFLIAEILKL